MNKYILIVLLMIILIFALKYLNQFNLYSFFAGELVQFLIIKIGDEKK